MSAVYTGKRGQAFEYTLDYTNKLYKNKGVALINKRPTPVKVIKSRGTRVLTGFFEAKSTVDYDGVYNGKAIYFEAKTTKLPRFPLDMLHDHQAKYLDQVEKQGAISFLIVEMRRLQDVFLVPNNMLQKYIKNARAGGKKSISIDDLEVYAHLIESKNGVPLDYLSVVDDLVDGE